MTIRGENVRRETPLFSFSVGVRKIMIHFVVNSFVAAFAFFAVISGILTSSLFSPSPGNHERKERDRHSQ